MAFVNADEGVHHSVMVLGDACLDRITAECKEAEGVNLPEFSSPAMFRSTFFICALPLCAGNLPVHSNAAAGMSTTEYVLHALTRSSESPC